MSQMEELHNTLSSINMIQVLDYDEFDADTKEGEEGSSADASDAETSGAHCGAAHGGGRCSHCPANRVSHYDPNSPAAKAFRLQGLLRGEERRKVFAARVLATKDRFRETIPNPIFI